MEPLDHDAAYKQIYGHAFMVEELARWRLPAVEGGRKLLGALDFGTLSRLPEQSAAGGRRRSGDMVWRVGLHGGRGPSGSRQLVLMEFQSDVDFLMALRCRSYVDGFHLEMSRGVRFGAAGRLLPVLMFVVYNGGQPWTAARRVAELVVPGAAAAEPTLDPARSGALFAGDGYLAVDSGRSGIDDAATDNAAALLAGLEHPTVDTAGGLALRLYRCVAAEELRPLRSLLLGWAQRVVERRTGLDIGVEDMEQVERLHESGELEAYFEERRLAVVNRYREEGHRTGREEGRRQARAEECARLGRLAAKRFGAEAAASLAMFLGDGDAAARLAVAGEWIVECDTAAELLARLGAARRTP